MKFCTPSIRYALVATIALCSVPQYTHTSRLLIPVALTLASIGYVVHTTQVNNQEDEKALAQGSETLEQTELKHGHLLNLFEKDPAKFPSFLLTEQLMNSLVAAIQSLSTVENALD